MNYKLSDIVTITNATVLQQSNAAVIEYLLLDSRKVLFPGKSVFFALDGPRRKGIDFIEELYYKGVRNFIIAKPLDSSSLQKYQEANFLLVNDVLNALQSLTAHHRRQFEYPIIGITGSNGKTIVKEWLYQLLSNKYNVVRSPKSYNSQIGVPLSIWQMDNEHTLGIFEAGISMPNEMNNLEAIIQPSIGVLTFIGEAHAEGFVSLQQKLNEKLTLFKNCASLIYCAENAIINESVAAFIKSHKNTLTLFSWSRNASDKVDLLITHVDRINNQTVIHCKYQNTSFSYLIPFTDEASIYNAITCCAVLLHMGEHPSSIAVGMNELRSVAMRLELKQGINHCSIINDSYSSDINSLAIALDFLSQQQQHSKKSVVLSDMLQSGKSDDMLYRDIASILQQKNLYRFIGIGPKIKSFAKGFDKLSNVLFFPTTEDFIKHFPELQFQDETILLKGARLFEFEKISNLLEQKIHETVLEINLNALRNNIKTYRQAINKEVKLMAMVKAFSYGSGSYEIANLLQHEGLDYLGVAYTDEGVELRKAGIRLPIMVMNTTSIGFNNLIAYQLQPEIYSFNILNAFREYLIHHQVSHYPIHLKLDTGMHRLGFMPADIDSLCEMLKDDNVFKIQSVFSHLVASENPAQDSFTSQQAASFLLMTEQIENTIGYSFIKHLANTAAVKRHPSLQLDMIRIGIGLYGVDDNYPVENVTTLKTTISQIKHIKNGETVGYGRKGMVNRDSIIATVRIGYADGYPRLLSNGIGKMLINGKMAPVIGNVCMDMTMIDITGINAAEGDEVIVFGEAISVQTVAAWANTIPYEILTNISHRVKRIYFEE